MGKLTRVVLDGVERLARNRRGAGEPVWIAVAAAVWLVRRQAARSGSVLWRGTVGSDEVLTVSVRSPERSAPGAR